MKTFRIGRGMAGYLAGLMLGLLSLTSPAGAALLGVSPGLPTLAFDNTGTLSYTAASGDFSVTVVPAFALFPPAAVRPVLPDGGGVRSVTINIQLDGSGALVGGAPGDDLVVVGRVDTTGDGVFDANGVLLTGEIIAFGAQDSGTANDDFDFRFQVTGGQLAGLFAGQDIGLHLDAENATFTGAFDANFSATFVKGSLGPIPTACVALSKQISIDGGNTWADADTADAADVPVSAIPGDAEYRMVVENCGTGDLTNVQVDDPTLGLSHLVGDLAAGASVTLTQADVSLLYVAGRCANVGVLINAASVTADAVDTVETFTAADTAVINCIGTPGIKLLKQISLDGIAWADADSAGAADTPSAMAPADAYYRFLVSNVGNVDLENVVLSDPALGIVHTLGALAAGQEVVVDAGVIADGLFVAQRCTGAGDFINIAEVSGDAVDTGATVSDSNPAVLTCITPPPVMDGQGCTPGYWRQPQHYGNWSGGYSPDMLFAAAFEDAFPGKTLGEVVQLGGGGLNALGRHTVAALLNAAADGVSYGMTPAQVIEAFNAVYPGGDTDYEPLKNQFAAMNERGCPLNRACLPGADKNGKHGHDKSYDPIEPKGDKANCDPNGHKGKGDGGYGKDGNHPDGGKHGGGKPYDPIEPKGDKANCDPNGQKDKGDGGYGRDGYHPDGGKHGGDKSYDAIDPKGDKASCDPKNAGDKKVDGGYGKPDGYDRNGNKGGYGSSKGQGGYGAGGGYRS